MSKKILNNKKIKKLKKVLLNLKLKILMKSNRINQKN